MVEIILTNLVEIVAAVVLMLIGVLGTWLTTKIGKKESLQTINAAQQEVIQMAQITVSELKQTVVDGLKAGHEDGKLTKEEIAALGQTLLEKTMAKMSTSTYNLLNAAGVDVVALITGAGESWIDALKADVIAGGIPIEVETVVE